MKSTTQTIFRLRRDYNSWVANETLEDYALRYTPHSARKWSEFRVANTAFGALSFLALEAIGGAIALNYGFSNALWAILIVGAIIFLTGVPIAVYAARHGLDMDLLTRGAGFGYLGSTITSLIYASFTFIFFALEAAIMSVALKMAFGLPMVWCYVISSLVIIPLVLYGITWISRLQTWTQPLWIFLLIWPFVWIAFTEPRLYREFTGLSGLTSGTDEFNPMMFGAASAVVFSLIVQIGEQVDFLRFMPERTAQNTKRWWGAVLLAGPGWILVGILKMLGGAFLAFVALQYQESPTRAADPTLMYLHGFNLSLDNQALAVWVTLLFVVVSQVKINITNAYAGSLAWSNFFARITRSHPGRVVWLVFNVLIATLLMTMDVFSALERVLGFYSNVAIAWVGALVADLVISKPLGLSPKGVEFRRAYLYDVNPVGVGAMSLAAALACVAYSGALGAWAEAFAPFIALFTSMATAPLLAWLTQGRYYLARQEEAPWVHGQTVKCTVCGNPFESPDMATCPAYGAAICSLCCSLESRCHDRCKKDSRVADQLRLSVIAIMPRGLQSRFNFKVAQYFTVFLALSAVMAFLLAVIYLQESLHQESRQLLPAFIKVYTLLVLLAAVCSWWVVLAYESWGMAHQESERQTQLLQKEIDAHKRTDRELQAAKVLAESASQAKTRYVAGMTHELRTPLNSILGYAQILLNHEDMPSWQREGLGTIQHSGQHMHALIDGLLDLARIEAGRLRLDVAPLPFPEFLSEVARMVQPQAEAKGLQFQLVTHGHVPGWVRADAKRLRQILINLLANAVRFTQKGSVTFAVDCRHDVVRFEVTDTGIGIAPQDQERIFLPFERGAAGRRSSEPGTGLGLTITRLLTELMGGELTLHSEPGQGSVFTVRVYLREIDPQPLPEQAALAQHGALSGYLGPRRTLLVVDDQAVQRQLLAGLLVPLGFVIHEAASGRECLDVMAQEPPDAILLDINMDDLDGWQTARLIRDSGATQVPIIIVSANLFENRPELLAQAGCAGFVGKPVILSELLEVLARNLQLVWTHEVQQFPMLQVRSAGTPSGTISQGAGPSSPDSAPVVPGEPANRPLPEALRLEWLRLARLGHASGLRAALRQARQDEPGLAATLEPLQAQLDRFDFAALGEHLKNTSKELEDDGH